MSTSPADPMAGVTLYQNREVASPQMDRSYPVSTSPSRQARKVARRQERQRLAAKRDKQRAARAAADEARLQEHAEAEQRKTADMAVIRSLQTEVFELITQQDAWNRTFRTRFKTRLAYELHVQTRHEQFILTTDGRIWMKLMTHHQFAPFRNVNNAYIDERVRRELIYMLELARSELKVR